MSEVCPECDTARRISPWRIRDADISCLWLSLNTVEKIPIFNSLWLKSSQMDAEPPQPAIKIFASAFLWIKSQATDLIIEQSITFNASCNARIEFKSVLSKIFSMNPSESGMTGISTVSSLLLIFLEILSFKS